MTTLSLVGFSCKGRGACPSCSAKRMAGTAAHLVDHVFPHVPVRQFVLSRIGIIGASRPSGEVSDARDFQHEQRMAFSDGRGHTVVCRRTVLTLEEGERHSWTGISDWTPMRQAARWPWWARAGDGCTRRWGRRTRGRDR